MGDVTNEFVIGAWMTGFTDPIPYGCCIVSMVSVEDDDMRGMCL
jgi:hypothetical protein